MRNKFFWIIIGILIAILSGVILTAINSSQKVKEASSVVVPSPQTKNKEGEISVKEVIVQANEYSFFPNLISVKAGQTVKIIFRNMGAMPHNFILNEFDVASKTIGSGQSDTFEFVPDKAGDYFYYCNIGNHRELGMEGTLEVK
jgi:plastocyanin